jgi:hypothetical protein
MNQIKPKSNQNSSMKFMLAVLVLIEICCVGQAMLLAERQIVTCPLQFFCFSQKSQVKKLRIFLSCTQFCMWSIVLLRS